MNAELSDADLKDIVAQMLENNGILGKIKAQLRANVYLALEEHNNAKKKLPSINMKLKQFLDTEEGSLVFSLVRDFLEFFELEYTLNVFDTESCTNKKRNRRELFDEFGLKINDHYPVLTEVLQSRRNRIDGATASSANQESHIKDDKDRTFTVPENSILSHNPVTSAVEDKSDNSDSNDDFFDKPVPDDTNSALYKFASQQESNGNDDVNGNSDKANLRSEIEDVALNVTKSGDDKPIVPDLNNEDLDDLAAIDKRIADLGFEIPQDEEYDDDFSSTTTRDKSENLNTEQSIEEEIDEVADISISHSEADDLTSDKTVSQIDQVSGLDYAENLE